ncbi:hypothetical protein JNUCC0626_13805 [Lentzea sp. JNUCC 0626]|uniref:hypothetical protein n=1 Tax=Lentzea sp. JNUCC 0626 TaxID=3367513 RepID=UPI00374A6B7C
MSVHFGSFWTTPPVHRAPPEECGITSPAACIGEGVSGIVHMLVGESLNTLLSFVGSTLLSTPTLDQLPRIGELWEQSRLIVVAAYSLVVTVAGLVVMSHETVQTRYALRDVAPRVVLGFIAANVSLPIADYAIRTANALSAALFGEGVDPQQAGQAVAESLVGIAAASLFSGGLFAGLLGVVLMALLVALLVGYVVRVMLTVVLVAGAPLALMVRAQWFWRAGAAVLGIQVVQSLALICGVKVFLDPGGFQFFGSSTDGTVNLIVLIALIWIITKVPNWMLHQVWAGHGQRSFATKLVGTLIVGKTMGALGLRKRAAAAFSGKRGQGSRPVPAMSKSGAGTRPVRNVSHLPVLAHARPSVSGRTNISFRSPLPSPAPSFRQPQPSGSTPPLRKPSVPPELTFRTAAAQPASVPRTATSAPKAPVFQPPVPPARGGGQR